MNRPALAALLATCTLLAGAAPAAAGFALGWTIQNEGTATVNGSIGAAEWANAFKHAMQVQVAPGNFVTATVYVMTDAQNLYVALLIPAATDRGSFGVGIDADVDGTCSLGDDEVGENWDVGGSGSFGDFYRNAACSSFYDTSDGGVSNGGGGWTVGHGRTQVEIAHPYDSSDDAHDVDIGPYGEAGIFFTVTVCPASGPCLTSAAPGVWTTTAELLVPGTLLANGFETGAFTGWTSHAP